MYNSKSEKCFSTQDDDDMYTEAYRAVQFTIRLYPLGMTNQVAAALSGVAQVTSRIIREPTRKTYTQVTQMFF